MPASESPAAASATTAAVATHAPDVHAAPGHWSRTWSHLRASLWLKAIGTTAFMWLFFVGYFHLLRHPAHATTVMPLTAIDHWVDFHAWALWPYVSLWVYVALPPALLANAREVVRYGWWVGALCVAGLACFYLWPTAVAQQVVVTPSHAGFELLRGVDAAGNACPSLHVAAATFSALWLERLLRELALPKGWRFANALWYVLIVWSTLAVKQHVWWDVVAGLVLALAIGLPSLRWVRRKAGGDIMSPR
jgi:hypothetical protein